MLGYLRIACSLECFQDDLCSLDQSLRARGASYHVLKKVELQGTDMNWSCLRIGHCMLLLRIAFSLILSYPSLPRYFREPVLGSYKNRNSFQNLQDSSNNGSPSPVHQNLNVSNTVAVTANNKIITFYINQQKIAQVDDSSYSQGEIGVAAESIGDPTEVKFSNAQIWTF
jgi:hypothetical protein